MALVVFDASLVIAHLDGKDALHDVAQAVFESHAASERHLPVSAYAEVLVGPIAAGRLERARTEITSHLRLRLVPIDEAVAEAAAALRASRPSLRLPDALVVACGEILGADAVLTGDRRWAGLPRVEVVGAED